MCNLQTVVGEPPATRARWPKAVCVRGCMGAVMRRPLGTRSGLGIAEVETHCSEMTGRKGTRRSPLGGGILAGAGVLMFVSAVRLAPSRAALAAVGWPMIGGDPQQSYARPNISLGEPCADGSCPTWSTSLRTSYNFAPSIDDQRGIVTVTTSSTVERYNVRGRKWVETGAEGLDEERDHARVR